jgi:AraC-like DNA-binding protein
MKETGFEFLNMSDIMMHRYEAPRDWVGSGIKDKTNELIFSLDGECVVTIENNSYIIKPNMFVVFPYGKKFSHRLTSKRRFSYYQCHFYGEINGTPLFEALGIGSENLAVEVTDPGAIISLFEGALHDERFTDEASMWINRTACGTKIIAEYVRLLRQAMPGKSAEEFLPVISYMKENLSGNVDVNTLSELCHLDPSYFIRKFTKEFGMPPMKYFDMLRAQAAMSMLENSDMDIEEVASEIGITDKYYFNKFFTKHCDITPSEYRKLFRI